jgi:hypothetical protein
VEPQQVALRCGSHRCGGDFLWVFIAVTPGLLSHERPITPIIHNASAFGACAFLMMTVILCIGPLARLDR